MNKTVCPWLALMMILAVSPVFCAEPLSTTEPVYVAGEDEVNIYRIPSLLVTSQGTLLAFCEARQGGDKSPTDLVVKRSDDLGKTWGEMQVVCRGEGGAIMNPTPVVDRQDGTILLACNLINRKQGLDRIQILHSRDDGESWSSPIDITDQVGPVHPGPGVAIQLADGRIVVPGRSSDSRGQSLVIYSDDHGQTWTAGQRVAPQTNESQVVELADGRLLINMRSGRGKGCRAVAFSRDRGQSWSDFRDDPALVEPVCQASIIRYRGSDAGDKDLLLFANPAQSERGNRTNMTICLSEDAGATWPISRQIHAEAAAYCCLAALPDGTIGLLYEGGKEHPSDSIMFARCNMEWLRGATHHSLED